MRVRRRGTRRTISFDVPEGHEDAWAAMLTLAIDPRTEEMPLQFVYDVTTPSSEDAPTI